jgi:hypothetical protein
MLVTVMLKKYIRRPFTPKYFNSMNSIVLTVDISGHAGFETNSLTAYPWLP